MSWWETGDGKLMGDEPADVAGNVLEAIAADRVARSQPKPTPGEFVNALAAALRAADSALIEGQVEVTPMRVVASTADGRRFESGGPRNPDDRDVALLIAAVEKIAKAYQDDWERRPQIREVLYAFLFVLKVDPEDYLSGAEGLELNSLTADRGDTQ